MALSLAAGLAGGILSQYIAPALVHAQGQTPTETRYTEHCRVAGNGNELEVFRPFCVSGVCGQVWLKRWRP